MVKKYGQLYRETISRLRPSEGELAAQAARELLAMASGKEIAAVLAELELYASEKIEQTLGELTERYLAGCPLAYLSGSWDFYGLRFTVTQLNALPAWEGDNLFLSLMQRRVPFFSLKLVYEGEHLTEAVLNGERIR